jgi:hypothetical protein
MTDDRPKKRPENVGRAFQTTSKQSSRRDRSPSTDDTEHEGYQGPRVENKSAVATKRSLYTPMEMEYLCVQFLKNRELLDGTGILKFLQSQDFSFTKIFFCDM